MAVRGRGFRSIFLLILVWSACSSLSAQVAGEEREDGDNPAARLRWFYEQRTYPFDTLKSGYRLSAYREAQLSLKERTFHPAAALSWSSIGPSPAGYYSGRVPALAVHPADGNTLYIGAADGGVWKTTNGGTSWVPLTDDQPSLASGCLAIDPVNPNVIYYGTGEPYNSIDAYGGAGVLKSVDAGATWSVVGLTNEKRITRIAINPLNPDILLAATWGGIYRSTTGGTSWTKTSSFSGGWDVAINPSNPLICYAGASGCYKSTDGGITWAQMSNGLPTSTARLVLAIAPSAPSTLFVLVSNTTCYKSTDGGASWQSVTVPADLFYGGQGWYDIAAAVDPANPNHVFIAGFDPYYSTDGGATWTDIAGQHPDCHIFGFGPGVMYLGSDGGVARSTDGGATFARVNNNLAITQFYSVGTNTLLPSEVWGGTQDNGTLSTTGSLAWTTKFGGDGGIAKVEEKSAGMVYIELQNGVHYRSTNSGAYWYAANVGIGESGAWVTPVALHPDTTGILYTATSKVYRSADSAKSWQPTNTSYPWGGSLLRQLATSKTSAQTLYASPGATLYRSTDAGVTWTNVSTGLPGRTITSIVPHRSVPSRVYVTVSGSGTGHVFLSTDAGNSWTSISGNLPTDLPANSIALDPASDQNLFVGTDLGLWSSGDGGATWVKDNGLPNSAVIMLGVTSDNALIAATHGRSMFKASLSSGPFVTVVSPNGGENWNVGTSHPITWSQSGIANVRIDYSTNGGGAWTTVAASVPASAGSYAWTVPATTTTQATVRISDASNAALADSSNAFFTISAAPTVAVTSPNGGESWLVSSLHSITWTSSNITSMKLEYSTNGGGAWNTITPGTSASAGTYSWTVPNSPSTQALVRASDASNPGASDASDAPFTIAAVPAISVTAPNGGESWIAGSSHNITWTSVLVTNVKIEYSTNGGGSWLGVAASTAAAAGSYAWTVPATPSAQSLVRISDASNAALFDTSNAPFTIAPPPAVSLTSPNGGESWTVLSSHPITWSATSITNVKLEYSTNGGSSWTLVVSSVAASAGSYAWTVPNTPTTLASVRVSDASNAAVRDSSNALFTIAAAPAVAVLAPNGGETWSVGALDTIRWTSANVVNVSVDYSTDNGSTWLPVAAAIPAGQGSLPWTVPNTPSTHSRVRVSDASNGATTDQSDAAFTISAPTAVSVTAPNGGEVWNVASVHAITWSSSGLSNVKIKYSTNNGGTWITVSANTPASAGTYSWTVPNTPTAQGRVQVGNSSGSVSDMSDNAFTISAGASVTVLTPNGGENWTIGTTQGISWSSAGITAVNIEFSTDAGASWTAIASGLPASATPYAWTLPATATAQAMVRVSDASNAATNDVSNGVFQISVPAAITLLTPAGGGVLVAGNAQPITWNSAAISSVRIEYSTDHGNTWIVLDPGVPALPASYAWTVPATPTAAGLVRVSDAVNFVPEDENSVPFAISVMQFATPLVCTDNGAVAETLSFGGAGGATDGIDTVFGESELGPKPAAGTFDARWGITGSLGSLRDIRDSLGTGHPEAVYRCELQAGLGGYPFTLTWGALGKGVWTLRDATTHGTLFNVRMHSLGSFSVTDPSVSAVELVHEMGATQAIAVASSWNIISLPVDVDDPAVQSLFPGAASQAFSYGGAGYAAHDSLAVGEGYWLKFNAAQTFDLTGVLIASDTVALRSGWNMIGSISEPTNVASLVSIPPGILATAFFGFETGAYAMVDSILPGHGYWVKSTQAGALFLSPGALASAASIGPRRRLAELGLNTLTVEDRSGAAQTLFFGEGSPAEPSVISELPLLPPKGALDVRFASQRLVELYTLTGREERTYPLTIRSESFPLTLRWEVKRPQGARFRLSDGGAGTGIGEVELAGTGEIVLRDPRATTLVLTVENAAQVPAHFRLWQNYPNPFNPATTIRYDLPVNAHVDLSVYNMLGEEVARLVDETQEAGTRSVSFDARRLPSGMYTYRIRAGAFADERKMLLIK